MAKAINNLPESIKHSCPEQATSLHSLIERLGSAKPVKYDVKQEVAVPTTLFMFRRLLRTDLLDDTGTSHHRFVLIVNDGGDGTVVLDDVLVPMEKEQAVLIFPYQHHHYTNIHQSRLHWMFITFELFRTEALEPLRYHPVRLNDAARGHIRRMCEHWINMQEGDIADERLLPECALLLSEMLLMARDKSDVVEYGSKGAGRVLLQQIGDYLSTHMEQPVQVADIAEHVSLSESHLRSQFRKYFNMSLGCYIRRTKIIRAAQMLDITEMTVGGVARSCGFDSIYAFSRVFRQNVGVSPRRYRHREKSM